MREAVPDRSTELAHYEGKFIVAAWIDANSYLGSIIQIGKISFRKERQSGICCTT